jgi:predicted amidohydrolase
METATVACVQQRLGIMSTHEEFEMAARRFLRQAQAKGAQLVVFPELTGVMLAPPLISGFKLGFIKREDQGKQPTAGFMRRRLGRVSGAAAGALGGGLRGSLARLLSKDSDALRDVYLETFGRLAREFGTAIVGGSLYLHDAETGTVRNRAYLFDVDGEVLGYQDKLNLGPDELDIAAPGTELEVLQTRFGRLGLLVGRDVLYPELARILTMQGAELLAGIVASPGEAQAQVTRSALAMRTEENQVYGAASFMLGPNYLGQANREDLFGRSALLAPISLTDRGDGIVLQVGSSRSEGFIAAEMDAEALQALWETSRFRPRAQMNLGTLGPVLADFYREGITIEQAIDRRLAVPVQVEPDYPFVPVPEVEASEPMELAELPTESYEPELVAFESMEPAELPPEPYEPELEDSEPGELAEPSLEPQDQEVEALPFSVPEALSLTRSEDAGEE